MRRFFYILTACMILSVNSVRSDETGKRPLDSLKMKAGDEQNNDIKALKTELLVTNTEDKAIEQLKYLLKKHKNSILEPDLRLRLAELYMRRSKTGRFFEMSRATPTLVHFLPPSAQTVSSKHAIHQAIEVYQKLAKDFPRYSKMDLILFNTAFAQQQLNQPILAENLYLQVIHRFPNSPLIPEAHLAMGEIEFDRQKFSLALEHFREIEQYPNSLVYPFGLYKGAWSLYNLKQNADALQQLEKVVNYGKTVEAKQLDTRLDLRREALSDMTLFFEDVMSANQAESYFSKQAKPQELPGLLLKLSELYERHSRHEDRRVLLLGFIDKHSDSDQLPEAYNGLVKNYEDMRNRNAAVESIYAFDVICDNLKISDRTNKCIRLLSDTSLQLASKWLRTWKKNQGYPEFADASEKVFKIYLKRAPPSHDKDEARFAYAELLFQRKKYREASVQYELVSQPLLKEPMGHDASYGALLSLEKAVSDKWSDSDEQQFKKLTAFYVSHFPKGQYRLDIEFKQALIAYEKEHYDEAAPTFLRLGTDFAQQEKGLKAQDLYLDILNIKKDYTALKNYSAKLLKSSSSAERTAKLQKIYRESYFIEIQKMEESGKLQFADTEYKRFAKDNAQSDLAPKAWWNAIQIEYKTFHYFDAAKSSESYFDQFQKSPQSIDALMRAAQTYESMGQLDLASRVLLKLATAEPKNAMKWKALAADFLMLSHQTEKAESIYQELRHQKEDPQLASYALDKILVQQRKDLSRSDFMRVLQSIANSGIQPQASLARVELVEQTFQTGNVSQAFSEAKEVLNMGDGAAVEAKARARFVQAQILKDEFIKSSVKARMDRLALVLAIKTEKLEKAQSAYQAVIRYGDPKTTIESLKQLANCYTHYVQVLKTLALPEGMTPAEEHAFRAELQKLSIPLEEKGVDTIAQALQSAKRMNLFDGSVASLQAQLDEMNMKKQNSMKVDFQPPALSLPQLNGVGS